MRATLQVLALLLVAVAMALTLAHALELPGKLRLAREQYLATQLIYYPGFTIAGAAEPLGMIALLALLFVVPSDSAVFWLTAVAWSALAGMHAVYWLVTHPVNNFWLRDFKPGRLGAGFFGLDPVARGGDGGAADWTKLRDRWEYSHVARAGLGVVSFVALAAAVVLTG